MDKRYRNAVKVATAVYTAIMRSYGYSDRLSKFAADAVYSLGGAEELIKLFEEVNDIALQKGIKSKNGEAIPLGEAMELYKVLANPENNPKMKSDPNSIRRQFDTAIGNCYKTMQELTGSTYRYMPGGGTPPDQATANIEDDLRDMKYDIAKYQPVVGSARRSGGGVAAKPKPTGERGDWQKSLKPYDPYGSSQSPPMSPQTMSIKPAEPPATPPPEGYRKEEGGRSTGNVPTPIPEPPNVRPGTGGTSGR